MAGAGLRKSGKNLMEITLDRPVKEFQLETRNGLLAGLHWQAVEMTATTPKIIALHGWLDNAASFKPMAEYLLDCEIIAIDFPGHGHSDWRAGKLWYHLVDYLEDLALLHKHLSDDLSSEHQGWEKFHLLGHSLGGVISGLWAAAMPETLRSLSIIEGLGPLSDTAGENSQRLRKALNSLNKLEDKQLRVYESIHQAAQVRAKSSAMEVELAQILVERSLKAAEDNNGWHWSTDPRLMHISPNRYSETQILELLADIQTPSLLLHGDSLPDFVNKDVIQNRIKAARIEKVVCIKGHHHLHMQHPEITAKHVRSHISRHQ